MPAEQKRQIPRSVSLAPEEDAEEVSCRTIPKTIRRFQHGSGVFLFLEFVLVNGFEAAANQIYGNHQGTDQVKPMGNLTLGSD